MLFHHCTRQTEKISVAVINTNAKATAIKIEGLSLQTSDFPKLQVRLVKAGERTKILGDFKVAGDEVIFEPLVPFTSGLTYEILLDEKVVSEIEIPEDQSRSPELLAIYPSADTLPENLLKMYFHFSMPMVEGQALNHITMIRSDGDTMHGTFLNLQPELWNADGTVLTLWLDPGRIKRELIPNIELGAPLKSFEKYTLHVDGEWPGKNNKPLLREYSKAFLTNQRDDVQPNLSNWELRIPSSGTKEGIEIHFPEPIDYFLLKDVISILAEDREVEGNVEISDNEHVWKFFPKQPWQSGKYVLSVESKLEDLAGNNLNHPFDRVMDNDSDKKNTVVRTIDFEIK